MEVTPRKMNWFFMFKMPSAFFTGVRLKEITDTSSVVTVKYRWANQNPFNSMYFAVQSMAAELTTGALVIKKIHESGRKISMLVTNHNGNFTKKATGRITFVCDNGQEIEAAINKTIETGEGQTILLKSVGKNEEGVQVSAYEFEWSVRVKS